MRALSPRAYHGRAAARGGELMSTQESTGTVARYTALAAERFPDRAAARWKDGDAWRELNFAEVGEVVDQFALGLISLGIEAGDRVCVLANTRPEWTFVS